MRPYEGALKEGKKRGRGGGEGQLAGTGEAATLEVNQRQSGWVNARKEEAIRIQQNLEVRELCGDREGTLPVVFMNDVRTFASLMHALVAQQHQ